MKKPLLLALSLAVMAASCIAQPGKKTTKPAAPLLQDSIVLKGEYKLDTVETRFYIHQADEAKPGAGWISYADGYTITAYLVDASNGTAIPVRESFLDAKFKPLEGLLFDRKRLRWSAPPPKK